MTQGDKELLLKDLCARLPYEVKVKFYDHWVDEYEIIPLTAKLLADTVYIGDIKPYLFPLSSMTEEQKEDMIKSSCGIGSDKNVFDWYNKNHFDYRNLIDKNLAIDCTNLNIY